MRLYNAQSCTPMGMAKLQPTPSFPPQKFLPSPRRMRQASFRTTQWHDSKRATTAALQERYQPSSLRSREDNDREASLERQALLHSENENNLVESSSDFIVDAAGQSLVEEQSEQEEMVSEKSTEAVAGSSSLFLSFPRKKQSCSETSRKRQSAFLSPLRIAKYSFPSPPHRSEVDSSDMLDLVFSSSESSPLISKNETGTTAATSDIDGRATDISGSFRLDIAKVNSDTDAAKKLTSGSAASRNSSSTLSSNIVLGPVDDTEASNPFDEVDSNGDDDRTLFSPIPWQPNLSRVAKSSLVPSRQSKNGIVQMNVNLFEKAWTPSKFYLSDEFSEDESWIDFTNDPFVSRESSSLQRPSPSKVDMEVTIPNSGADDVSQCHEDDFVVKRVADTCTMEKFASRQSHSGTSIISFPSISAGGNTWSQAYSVDEAEDDEASTFFESLLHHQSSKPVSIPSTNGRSKNFLGSVLKARYEANRMTKNPKKTLEHEVSPSDVITKPGYDAEKATRASRSCRPGPDEASNAVVDTRVTSKDTPRNAQTPDVVSLAFLDRRHALSCYSEDADSMKAQYSPRGDTRRFTIHWQAHDEVGPNTFWSKVCRDEPWLKEILYVDESEFSDLFTRRHLGLCSVRAKEKQALSVRVIDASRASRGELILSQIDLNYDLLAQAIDRMDTSFLTVDQMKAILPFVPTLDDISKLQQSLRKATSSNWFHCECEKFMEVLLHVPDAEEKLHHMIFMKTFSTMADELKKDAILIQRACQEVMSSKNFRRALAVIMALGNRVNAAQETTHSETSMMEPPVRAIALDSLVLLNQTKAFDGQTTFLQFAASTLRKCAPDVVDWKQEDMPTLRRAHKIKWKLWQAEVDLMEAKLDSLLSFCPHKGGHHNSLSHLSDASLSSSTAWSFWYLAQREMQVLRDEGNRTRHALASLWQYFGEPVPPRPETILGRLVLFGSQWERAVDAVVRRDRQSRRSPKSKMLDNDGENEEEESSLARCSSSESRLSTLLANLPSYGHDV